MLFKGQRYSLLLNFTKPHKVKIIINFNFINNAIIFAKTANNCHNSAMTKIKQRLESD